MCIRDRHVPGNVDGEEIMEIMESVLTSIKKMLGITEEYEHFDSDIIMPVYYTNLRKQLIRLRKHLKNLPPS